MQSIKFLVFADLHHYPGVFYTEARERLASILKRAETAEVDCIISLGDFCHSPTLFENIVMDSATSKIPVYHVLGNHDTDGASVADVLKCYHMPHEYYYFDLKGFRFIALDTNYYQSTTGFTHFQFRNYFDFPETRETLPPEQLLWLEETIRNSPGPCILLSHSSIERECGGIVNREKILEIVRRMNSEKRKVLLALNGHHHRNTLSILDNVAYFDVNSASFDWCSLPHNLFPEQLRKKYEMVDHQIIYTETLSALVTVSINGEIRIEGKSGDFLHGITREMTDNPRCDSAGRACSANILSAHFQLV